MGHNGCDGSQASGPWAIGSGYRFSNATAHCESSSPVVDALLSPLTTGTEQSAQRLTGPRGLAHAAPQVATWRLQRLDPLSVERLWLAPRCRPISPARTVLPDVGALLVQHVILVCPWDSTAA